MISHKEAVSSSLWLASPPFLCFINLLYNLLGH